DPALDGGTDTSLAEPGAEPRGAAATARSGRECTMSDTATKGVNLRHGLSHLWPSEIADQFYCEYKVHRKRLHPEVRVELPPLHLGEASHIALVSQAEPISPTEIAQSIREGKKLALCEWVLEGTFRNVRIRGRPDFFAFEGMKGLLLLDFKFSSGRTP